MWKLLSIHAENLCAFKEFHYVLMQGVTTLIFGNNMDNDSQKSNGSGKSALVEAVALGITGSPLRKIKNEEIINDMADECIVCLQFQLEAAYRYSSSLFCLVETIKKVLIPLRIRTLHLFAL